MIQNEIYLLFLEITNFSHAEKMMGLSFLYVENRGNVEKVGGGMGEDHSITKTPPPSFLKNRNFK